MASRWWKLLLSVCLCCECRFLCTEAAVATTSHFPRRLQQTNKYLPPYVVGSYGERRHATVPSTIVYSTHPNAYSAATFRTSPQISSRKSSARTAQPKAYNSYAPPASGAAPVQYSTPQASSLLPLPALLPTSLVEQLSKSATAPLQQQQNRPQQPATRTANELALMIEQPAATVLTPNQSRTLQAARQLASALLEANGEPPLDAQHTAETAEVRPPQRLNTTDVLVVRAQKNAYIIPPPLANGARSPQAVRTLYEMRDTFERAYTINQFIFVIKPERINFLNKLV